MQDKACINCHWYEADQEDGNDGMGEWYVACRGRHGVSNLKQFPFRKTSCETFKSKSLMNGS